MFNTTDLPPEDIRDFVAVLSETNGDIRVKVVEAKNTYHLYSDTLRYFDHAIPEKSMFSILQRLMLSLHSTAEILLKTPPMRPGSMTHKRKCLIT